MHYNGAKHYILERLRNELPPNLYYHGYQHTVDVFSAAERLAADEHVVGEALTLLRTAALYHDAGFLEQYLDNETIAVRIVEEHLPRFDYSPTHIKIISGIIMATRVPQSPQTLLEQIMCDADLYYLGRDDFFTISKALQREMAEHQLLSSEAQWTKRQLQFFEQHTYFTHSARERREEGKRKHWEEIKRISA